jgi:2-phosphoglycolate phosphatase
VVFALKNPLGLFSRGDENMEPGLQRYRAVVFDFDGTLADSYEAITASVNHVRSHHGLAPLDVEEVKKHVGRGPIYLLEHTVPGGQMEADLVSYRAHHPTVMYEKTRFLPGALETLQALHEGGKLLGLCSNKPRLFSRELLRFLGIVDLFQAILGPEDVARPKPAPDMLLAALKQLGLEAKETLYVGDMIVDIQTARAAGVDVWIVPTGSEERAVLEEGKPDRLLENLRDMLG